MSDRPNHRPFAKVAWAIFKPLSSLRAFPPSFQNPQYPQIDVDTPWFQGAR
jgi:hypothetical protein